MNSLSIYKQLGNADYKFAVEVTNDDMALPSLRAIALCVLGDYSSASTLFPTHTVTSDKALEDIFWQEVKIMCGHLKGEETSVLQMIAEDVVSRAEWSIFSRTFLGTVLESKKEFSKAIELYQAVLSFCPTNTISLAGLIRSYIQLGKSDEARLLFKKIRTEKLLNGLERSRKIYWQLTLLNYEFIVKRLDIAIFTGLAVFLVAFFFPTVWIIPLLTSAFLGLIAFFTQKRYGVNMSFLKRLAIVVALVWLFSYGVKSIFIFFESK